MLTVLSWFMPHDLWSWLGYIVAAVIVALLWIIPSPFLKLAERIAGTVIIIAIVVLLAQHGALSRAEDKVRSLTTEVQIAKADAAAANAKTRLLEQAAIERAMDTKEVADLKKDLTDAIQSAPESAPGAASIALACGRLHHAGKTASAEYQRFCR